jgi:hypothetical protein
MGKIANEAAQPREPNLLLKFLGKRTGAEHEAFDPYKRLKE